ncbi:MULTISPECIES: hypothetical protein [Luteimonas]|uniref:hypothetical protein n=1 Tax=Luteimonas TaxID=83614 RepID=UPI000C7B1929|nr:MULTISPECIES: hypothetical protein [Luteimonas]
MKAFHTLALGIALAIGTGAPLQAAEPATASLSIGSETRGEITSRTAINYRDGSRSALYRVDLREGQVVSFQASGPLRARLSAFHDGELLGASPEGNENPTLVVRARRSGAHTLAVSGLDANAFGPFTLSAKAIEAYDGGTLQVGASISDWVDGPRRLPLQIDTAGLYVIDMLSDDFDAKLSLEGQGVSLNNDDGGDGTNARISMQLQPGRYTLTADGYEGSVNGMYQLRVASRELPEGGLSAGGAIELGTEATGLYQGSAQRFRFSLPARRLVRIDMRSSELDSMLTLRGNGIEKQDDDGGDGLDSRIVMLLEPGDYDLEVGTATEGAGLFTLALSATEVPANVGGGPLAIGRSTDATLLPGMTDRYTVSVRSAGDYTVDMRADDLDSHLRLLRGTEEVASDDDGGGALHARIQHRLEPGDYVIEATSVDSGATGRYTIGIDRR